MGTNIRKRAKSNIIDLTLRCESLHLPGKLYIIVSYWQVTMNKRPKIEIPSEEIKSFCTGWKITEFSLFGSVLREDFRGSDVDNLVRRVLRKQSESL